MRRLAAEDPGAGEACGVATGVEAGEDEAAGDGVVVGFEVGPAMAVASPRVGVGWSTHAASVAADVTAADQARNDRRETAAEG